MAANIPKRKYFTFEELAERWNCKQNDLREAISSGDLIPSAYFAQGKLQAALWVEDYDEERDEICDFLEPPPCNCESENLDNPAGFYYLRLTQVRGPFYCTFAAACTSATATSTDKTEAWYTFTAEKLSLADVEALGVFMHTEIARHEELAESAEVVNGPASMKTCLRVIGLMAHILSETKGQLQIGDRPNAKAIGDQISMQANKLFGNDARGFQSAHKLIGEALKELPAPNSRAGGVRISVCEVL
jgi:hypothetical protein